MYFPILFFRLVFNNKFENELKKNKSSKTVKNFDSQLFYMFRNTKTRRRERIKTECTSFPSSCLPFF